MKNQWECVLQNLGGWQGSFTRLSPQGEVLEDVPSQITLTGINHNQAIHLVLRREYAVPGSSDRSPQEMVFDFSAPGVGALFFETGAFSEGPLHFSSGSPFGAEFCLIDGDGAPGDRRMRLIQQYKAGMLDRQTLVREQRIGTDAPERSPLQLSDLLGNWHGTAITLYPQNAQPPSVADTSLQLAPITDTQLSHQSQWGDLEETWTSAIVPPTSIITSPPHHLTTPPHLHTQPYQTILLPDAASSTCPTQITPNQPFFLEVGWLLQPTLRQRLVRRYTATGQWESLTLIQENRG
jgi:hypothetical protein